jgi:hypothetical protein
MQVYERRFEREFVEYGRYLFEKNWGFGSSWYRLRTGEDNEAFPFGGGETGACICKIAKAGIREVHRVDECG